MRKICYKINTNEHYPNQQVAVIIGAEILLRLFTYLVFWQVCSRAASVLQPSPHPGPAGGSLPRAGHGRAVPPVCVERLLTQAALRSNAHAAGALSGAVSRRLHQLSEMIRFVSVENVLVVANRSP